MTKSNPPRFLIVCLLLGALLSPAVNSRAQQPGKAAEKTPVLEIEFSVFPLEPANWRGILYAPDGDPESGVKEIQFNPHERSLNYEYKGARPLRFYREFINGEGVTTYRVAGIVDPGIQPPGRKLILFFSPQSNNGTGNGSANGSKNGSKDGPYEIHQMTDGPDVFPEGSLVFFNTMPVSFLAVVGNENFRINPGASPPLDVREFYDKPAPMAVAIKNQDDLLMVIRNEIRFIPERRTLMILRKPNRPNSMRIRVQRLTEFTGEHASDPPPEGQAEEPARAAGEK